MTGTASHLTDSVLDVTAKTMRISWEKIIVIVAFESFSMRTQWIVEVAQLGYSVRRSR